MAIDDGPLLIVVVFSPAGREIDESQVSLPRGATVAQALVQSGLVGRHQAVAHLAAGRHEGESGLVAGVWGRITPLDHVLRAGDRVEVYRPLRVDPMEARRRRHKEQRSSNRR